MGNAIPNRVCHCGRPVEPRDPDPWEGRMDDYCYDCATCRCDTADSECPHAIPNSVTIRTCSKCGYTGAVQHPCLCQDATRNRVWGVRCSYCGDLDWTIRNYGRVTHKQACPHRCEPWSQTEPEVNR